jgi:SOS-response transcriptional repressor LexA
MEELTDIQRRVFEFIGDTLGNGRSAPTPREISAKFAWRSKRAAECQVEALIRKGRLTSEPSKARSFLPPFDPCRQALILLGIFEFRGGPTSPHPTPSFFRGRERIREREIELKE